MKDVLLPSRKVTTDRSSLLLDYAPRGLEFIHDHLEGSLDSQSLMATSTPLNVQLITEHEAESIINLKPINDVRRVNKFFETINLKLVQGGRFIGCFESKKQRKNRIFEKYPTPLAYLFYYLLDFPWKRIFPKVEWTKKL